MHFAFFFFHPSICPIWTKDDGLEGNHYEGDTLTLRVSSTFIWRCLWRTWATDRIGNGTVRGAGEGGAWRERNCCQEQMLNFLPFLFPKIRAAVRRSWGRGGEWWVLSWGEGGGSSIHFLNCFHSLAILYARVKVALSSLSTVLWLCLSWPDQSLPSIPYVQVSFF